MNKNEIYIKSGTNYKEMTKELLAQCGLASVISATRKNQGGFCMRETGIVRRIDELGRVVIPKEIRKTQRIRTGDSLEIYTDGNGGVIFKKYSPLAELGEPAAVYADVLARRLRCAVAVCDRAPIRPLCP